MSDDDIKKIMRAGKEKKELSPEMKEKIENVKSQLLNAIEKHKDKHENRIPFKVIQEETGLGYQLISDVLLALIMEKKLIGFLNDGGTERFDDDVLILREERMVDKMEPEYKTGYAE